MTAEAVKLPSSFHKDGVALVRQMEASGWTGRLGASGHVFMFAPDGVTTCSITPKAGSRRHMTNQVAVYRRWLREQAVAESETEPIQTEAAPEPEPAADPVDTVAVPVEVPQLCPECLRPFATKQALSVHHVRVHVRVNCPVCLQPFSPGNLDRHRATHRRELEDPEAVLAEVYRLRAEVAEWQALAEDAEARVSALQDIRDRAVAALLGE